MRHMKAAAAGVLLLGALALPLAMGGCGSSTTAPEEIPIIAGDWTSDTEKIWLSFEEDGTFIMYRSATTHSDVYIEGTYSLLPDAVRFNVDESTEKLWPPSTVQELPVLEVTLETLVFETPATFLMPPPRLTREEEDTEAAAELTGPGTRELTLTKVDREPNPERIPDIPEEPEEEEEETPPPATTTDDQQQTT